MQLQYECNIISGIRYQISGMGGSKKQMDDADSDADRHKSNNRNRNHHKKNNYSNSNKVTSIFCNAYTRHNLRSIPDGGLCLFVFPVVPAGKPLKPRLVSYLTF